jgi:hypothetical protein
MLDVKNILKGDELAARLHHKAISLKTKAA